jgi:uncharacterized damage-inducible protein DinB
MPDPRYPLGRFEWKGSLSEDDRRWAMEVIARTPAELREAVAGLDDPELDTPYREGGWTVRQVVHHLPDSHLNAYVRMKLALTEDAPVIKPYSESAWAELADSSAPVIGSIHLLEALHDRWARLMRSMSAADFERTFIHPEHPDAPRTLDWLLALYGWHGPHHIAQIQALRQRKGW